MGRYTPNGAQPNSLNMFRNNLVLLLPSLVHFVHTANILCVFPTPAFSHQSVFSAYTDRLAKAGHNVTVITPLPRRVPHLHEIDCSKSLTVFNELVKKSSLFKVRGVVADESTVTADNYTPLVDMVVAQFQNKNVTDLIENKANMFDLVVCEAYLSLNLIFGHLFDAPVIRISSGHGTTENFDTMGAVHNPLVYPSSWRSTFSTNKTQIMEIEHRLAHEWKKLERVQETRLKQVFGGGSGTSLHSLKKRVVLLLVNVHPVMDNNRPVSSNVQYLGGLHLKRAQSIKDEELRAFIKNDFVVYVSFGSMLDATTMDHRALQEFVRVMNALPYKVLWRVGSSVHQRFSVNGSNILTREWFPQRALLNSGVVKLFVTQGGLQSIDEAVDGGVPMLCIPMVGDQFLNCERVWRLGVGEKLDVVQLEQAKMDRMIVSMVANERYNERVDDLKKLVSDTPVNALRKVLWYTDKVLRNGSLMYVFNGNKYWSK
ncbi:ORF141 EGT [Cydia pomonella granulovirus]|uniref:Ecdysteroid UDP-glucosyltransferase n=2 Tax=Cydia pomonella granulosis virus TaxID=28289 RepID=Q91ER4_GVCPM|nr:ORF141 EGT [Cydia pomonella granulovirus]AAK70801.1 ORF141 EGT [Cydia pomonella granulovirus]AIU37066.1 ORF141 egt [Cydia pomonella granulovirus]AIU37208.1 ORF141 egt [Cydia pomonella granulovirus]AIU37346.1 ORF141 egt [Cydia pomonella granulovirus]QGY99275.1 EGT [Cydia pomonella granulovirus]